MKLRVGTSGYSYKEWKGIFYPEDLPAAKMLPFYAERFDTVEINNTFYRMPDAKMVAKWATQVGDSFTFVLKAPQRITHQKKLVGTEDDVRYLFEAAAALGEKQGPVLFQLPPFSRKDALKLRAFVGALPAEGKVAFEFRHASWCDDEIYSILRDRDIALCLADTARRHGRSHRPRRPGDPYGLVGVPPSPPHRVPGRRARGLGRARAAPALVRSLRLLQARGRGQGAALRRGLSEGSW